MSQANPDDAVRSKPILERHLQTLLLTLVAGLIAWQGMTTLELTETTARQDEKVMHLIALTEQLRQDIRDMDSDYLPRREAEMYRSETALRLETLDQRVTRLERVR